MLGGICICSSGRRKNSSESCIRVLKLESQAGALLGLFVEMELGTLLTLHCCNRIPEDNQL